MDRWNALQWSAMEWIDGMQCSGVEWNGVEATKPQSHNATKPHMGTLGELLGNPCGTLAKVRPELAAPLRRLPISLPNSPDFPSDFPSEFPCEIGKCIPICQRQIGMTAYLELTSKVEPNANKADNLTQDLQHFTQDLQTIYNRWLR